MENVHYLHDPKDVEEALTNLKTHWEDLEDRKSRLRGVETRLQGQSTLDECVEEYRRGSAEKKCCVANLARVCTVENLPLHISTRLGVVKSMRKWEPQWPSISKQSMTRSVERQSEELRKEIKREMEEVAKETDIAFTTDFWTSLIGKSFMMMSVHWITHDWRLKMRILGTISFPEDHTTANNSGKHSKLMNLRLESGLYPKSSDGRTPQCLDAVTLDKLL